MRILVLSLSLLVSAISFGQTECCNVVDSAGVSVISSNEECVIAENLLPYTDCKGDKKEIKKEIKKEVAVAPVIKEVPAAPVTPVVVEEAPAPPPAPKVIELNEEEKAVLARALEGVKFQSNSDVLLPASLPKLDAVAEVMNAHSDYNLTIDGYTDNRGNVDHNQRLSLKRAEAAKARLIRDGIDGNRITTHGYGIENPIDTNSTSAGRARNRRVEFKVSF